MLCSLELANKKNAAIANELASAKRAASGAIANPYLNPNPKHSNLTLSRAARAHR